ncbi:MAG: two-component system, chemotaxis family, CheB/CheR fusion protein [Solirubrobacteraceae bacterium]|nr:two-component system, chemotaxis family, CheB/CheR fusion protein [Solirubrobacteraceae bacterium]
MSEAQPVKDDAPLEALLTYLHRTRGFDFSSYKRASLERRLRKRMDQVGAAGYGDYLDVLEVQQDEFEALFDTILINVTGFFRDPQSWDYYATEIIPRLIEGIDPEGPIRVWSAGCASGEETYTLAMVLAEALGEEAYLRRVKIYATEVDEEALAQARQGNYTGKQVEPVPHPLLERYFERIDQRYAFRKNMRRTVIFGRNDLTQDAPISRIDLLTCRNTLMYFNAETQARILKRLHFALNPWGYLFLGKSEMLITHTDLFRPVNLKRRVFAKVAKPTLRDRLEGLPHVEHHPAPPVVTEIRDGAFDAGAAAQLVVDADGMVVLANAEARAVFGLSQADIGRSLKDLELSYRPADLRTHLEVAYKEGRTVTISPVSTTSATGDTREFEVQIVPLHSGERMLGASILYQDVTRQRRVEDELGIAKRELESAYEELQSTVEELETTNEELQSTNEELETTNEELQSANEELETMNEELQSTNEELETINDELRERSRELNEVNAFLETILSRLGVAVIVVDRDQTVQIWNAESAELWGVRADEAEGRHLLGLDFGLPLEGVRTALRRVLAGSDEQADLELDATNRRGRDVRLRVTCLPLSATPGTVTGAILVTEQISADGASADGASADGAGRDGAG